MDEIKKCPKCKEDIKFDAKKCKHCGADLRNWIERHKILTVLISISFLIIVISGGSSSQNYKDYSNQESAIDILKVGEDGIINNNELKTNCDGSSILTANKDDLEEFINISIANDKIGLYSMIKEGKIFLIPNCTKVKVIGILASGSQRVRILEGLSMGKDGWIAYEFIIREQ
jgi:hypothetical protein